MQRGKTVLNKRGSHVESKPTLCKLHPFVSPLCENAPLYRTCNLQGKDAI